MGYHSIVIKGDTMSLKTKLKRKSKLNNALSLFAEEILLLYESFHFISWSHVKCKGEHSSSFFNPYSIF